MGRVWKALTRDYGKQVPSGMPMYGWVFWLIGAFLMLLGILVFIVGNGVGGAALVVGGFLLVLQTFSDKAAPPK